MATKLYQLQSGFVTMNASRLMCLPDKDLSLRESLLVTDYSISDTDNYYDEGIDDLIHAWKKNSNRLLDFGFRTNILQNAIRVFKVINGDTLGPWLKLQLNNRHLSPLHFKFLSDVFGNYGRREIDAQTYYRLLASDRTVLSTGRTMDLNEIIPLHSSASLSELLTRWTRSVDGYADLLMILNVIFGSRHGFTATAADHRST